MDRITDYYFNNTGKMKYINEDIQEALSYLSSNFNDCNVNNNVTHISSTKKTLKQDYKYISMKQSYYKNINFDESMFENVAFTGTSFENVTFNNSVLIGNSFANCDFLRVDINGNNQNYEANNFSQSNFEQCKFKEVKLFRTGSLNTLFHNCQLTNVQFRGSTFEGAKFKNCKFNYCDFGRVNLDYSMFVNNKYNNITFPFYQFAYIIGMAHILQNEEKKVYLLVGDKNVSLSEYILQIDKLILFYLDKSEYFPVCNLCIAKGDKEDARNFLLDGINKAISTRNFRMISNLCFLAGYHGILNDKIRYKINKLMDDFIQGEDIPESQLNYYLIYMGKIRTILEKGSSETVTLNYLIKTNTCKANSDGVSFVNDLINRLNTNLSDLNDVEGFKVTISNYSPFEIAVGVITIISGAATVADILFKSISNFKEKRKNKDAIIESNSVTANNAYENGQLYLHERIERMKNELLLSRRAFSKEKLDDRIVAVTQSLQTDIEDFYSKQFMYFKVDNKKKRS